MRASIVVAIGLAAAMGCTRSTSAPRDAGTDAPFMIGFDAMIDVGTVCEPGTISCFGTCTRVAGDSNNCGSCGNRCPEGVSCAVGYCNCEEPKISCDGVCLDPSLDPENCGTCGNACSDIEMCTDGTCIVDCDPPNMICYERDAMDVEVAVCADPMTNANHCGRCNTRCSGGATCRTGRCQCPVGWLNCDGACVDPATDASNCGSCRISCGPGGVCVDSVCTTCGGGLTACGGRCVDTMTDTFHCGACSRACGLMETCTAGTCDCATGLTDCVMSGGCTDLDTDVRNCGTCGTDCGPGGACAAGACTCASGYMMCGSSCRDTTLDRNNCGMCGRVCPGSQVCYMSACTSSPPTRYAQAPGAVVAFVDACAAPGHATYLPSSDDASVLVSLPFPFRYWATDLPMGAMINVTTNGWIGMNGVMDASLGGSVPSTFTPNAVIAPHWGDNFTRGGICVATVGTAPNRRWIVEWPMAHYFADSSPNLTFEIILSEGTNTIDFVYGTMTGVRAQTIGIENQTGMMGLNACPGGTGSCAPMTGQVIRFVPIP